MFISRIVSVMISAANVLGCGEQVEPAATTQPVAPKESHVSPTTAPTPAVNQNWEILTVVRNKFPDVRQLSTQQLAAWQADASKPQPVLLDVRKREEFDVSHLPGAIHIDPGASPEELAAKLTALGIAKGQPIVAYCSVGYRSSACAKKLGEVGFTDVVNLEGSIFRWANEGRTVVRTDGTTEVPTHEVHPFDAKWGKLLSSDFHPPGK